MNISPGSRSGLTLALSTILHSFTHAYQSLLIPLYLLMVADLRLPGVRAATLIVAAYSAVYFLLSYPAGVLADRFNRKMLLGVGMLGNAAAIALMGATHHYAALLALGLAAGVFGSLFHPAANALMSAHYPKSPGMALGMLGIGSGIGFYFGPRYSGWRAQTVGHDWLGLSKWQLPCVELGLVGIVVGIVFLVAAREVQHIAQRRARVPMGARLRWRTLAIAGTLGWRDFAGSATTTLISIYLQKAHGYDAQSAGRIIGVMGLVSVVATPLAVWLTPGRRRLPGLATAVICGGAVLITVPHVPLAWLLTVLAVFQVFLLSGYALGEVSLVERVDGAVRGRVIGLYLTVCGTMGAVSPWVIGWWNDRMGPRASVPSAYFAQFAVLGAIMICASAAVRLIARIGQAHELPAGQAIEIAEAEPIV